MPLSSLKFGSYQINTFSLIYLSLIEAFFKIMVLKEHLKIKLALKE